MKDFRRVFGDGRPVMAIVHLGAPPGTPLCDAGAGVEGLIAAARAALPALPAAGVDAVMSGHENDHPIEFKVDIASTTKMAHVIGRLRSGIAVPCGVNVLWDPTATVAPAAATGATLVRESFTGAYASDMGPRPPDADSLDRRPGPDRARSAVFSLIPDAMLVSGHITDRITGEAARMEDLESVKRALSDVPAKANRGVKHGRLGRCADRHARPDRAGPCPDPGTLMPHSSGPNIPGGAKRRAGPPQRPGTGAAP